MDEKKVASAQLRLLDNLKELYTNKELCDVSLTAELGPIDQKIECHRVILASASEYLKQKLLTTDTSIECNIVVVPGVNFGALKEVVDYIYTNHCDLKAENIPMMCVVSSCLKMTELYELAEQKLLDNLKYENCFDMYDFFVQKQCEVVLTKVMLFIQKNFKELAATDAFIARKISDVVTILERDELNCTEDDVFRCVQSYITQNVDIDSSNIDRMLSLVRYEHLSVDTLYGEVLVDKHVRSSSVYETIMTALKNKSSGQMTSPARKWLEDEHCEGPVVRLNNALWRYVPTNDNWDCIKPADHSSIHVQYNTGQTLGFLNVGNNRKNITLNDLKGRHTLNLPDFPLDLKGIFAFCIQDEIYFLPEQKYVDNEWKYCEQMFKAKPGGKVWEIVSEAPPDITHKPLQSFVCKNSICFIGLTNPIKLIIYDTTNDSWTVHKGTCDINGHKLIIAAAILTSESSVSFFTENAACIISDIFNEPQWLIRKYKSLQQICGYYDECGGPKIVPFRYDNHIFAYIEVEVRVNRRGYHHNEKRTYMLQYDEVHNNWYKTTMAVPT